MLKRFLTLVEVRLFLNQKRKKKKKPMFGSNKQKSLQLNLFGGLPSKQKSVIATNAAVLQRPFWGRLGSKSCQDKGTSCLMWNHGVRMVGIGGSN